MGDRERSGVYSAEAVLGRLVEKDKLYQEYRKAMEAAGDTAEPMRYVNENGRTIAADTSMEAVAGRRKEYEKMIEGPKGSRPGQGLPAVPVWGGEGTAGEKKASGDGAQYKPGFEP